MHIYSHCHNNLLFSKHKINMVDFPRPVHLLQVVKMNLYSVILNFS